MTDKNGGPAFPTNKELNDYPNGSEGMTLRDYFATKIMQSLIDKHTSVEDLKSAPGLCYMIADAMLKERNK